MEDVIDKRGQADKIKVQCVRGPRALEQDEGADEQVEEADNLEIGLLAKCPLRWGRHDQVCIDPVSIAFQGVCRLGPDAELIENQRHMTVVLDGLTVNCL